MHMNSCASGAYAFYALRRALRALTHRAQARSRAACAHGLRRVAAAGAARGSLNTGRADLTAALDRRALVSRELSM